MNYIKYLLFSLLFTNLLASCNYMDYDDQLDLKGEFVYTNQGKAKNLLAQVYGCVPSGFNEVNGAMFASATDDAEHSNPLSSINMFNTGQWNKYSNPDNKWGSYYKYIENGNLYLENTGGLNQANYDKYRWQEPLKYFQYKWDNYYAEGEVYFLRALSYFELMKRYGAVPILRSTVQVGDSLNIDRRPVSEVMEEISKDCLKASDILLKDWNLKITFDGEVTSSSTGNILDLSSRTGRPTKGAAYALLAKAYLYAASPLHNDGNYNIAYCDSAAKYAAKVIDLGQYRLEDDYATLFKSGRDFAHSKELIFERRNADSNGFEQSNYPVSIQGAGSGATCPSENLAEAFEMKSRDFGDNGNFDWNNPECKKNPFANRDPRFDATFLCNGQSWYGGHIVQTWDDGLDGMNQERGTKTGYYLRKYVDPNLDLQDGKKSRHTWYLFRLADIYLMFAEAANEAYSPSTVVYGHTALEAINKVRERVNMFDISTTDKSEFRLKVRHERRVELAFEDSRYWDVKRWNIGEETFGSTINGLSVQYSSEGDVTYAKREVENRVYREYMDLYPIPESEILKNSNLKQNPGWEK